MEWLLPVIGQRIVPPASITTASQNGSAPFLRPVFRYSSRNSIPSPKKMRIRVQAEQKTVSSLANSIDFGDPDWKSKYQKDFEARFNIPHLTDVFPDTEWLPSTFCLRMRYLFLPCFGGRKNKLISNTPHTPPANFSCCLILIL